jgi:hypothetical protein
MRLLNDAKSILLDPVQRKFYDIRVGIQNGNGTEEAIIIDEEEVERYEAIEIGPVKRKMARVISSMKDVFSKDEEFKVKLDIAQETIEANVIEESGSKVTVVEDGGEEVEEVGVEMKLEFTEDQLAVQRMAHLLYQQRLAEQGASRIQLQ